MNIPTLDKPIAQGRTADVYLWDDTRVLKLFHKWFELESIEYEFKIARTVRASGIKTPAALELIQVEGRNGLLYERAKGETMLAMFQRRPNRDKHDVKFLRRLYKTPSFPPKSLPNKIFDTIIVLKSITHR